MTIRRENQGSKDDHDRTKREVNHEHVVKATIIS